jgi:hypothetical protein
MTNFEAIDAIHNGRLVECTKDEYNAGLRTVIQDQAGKWIETGQSLRAIIALEEVKRLDKIHNS